MMPPSPSVRPRNARQRGQVLVVALVFFTLIVVTTITGVTAPIVREIRAGKDLHLSKQSYFTAEAGSEDAYYRVHTNQSISFPTTLVLNNATATTERTLLDPLNQEIVTEGNAHDMIRTVVKNVTVTNGFGFVFALLTGIGGISLSNNASVRGDVYSNGPIIGTNASANSYNIIKGSVVSAGPSGFVERVRSTSTAYSHVMKNITVDKDAYYQHFAGATSSVTVTGTKYPNSVDLPVLPLPITDPLIEEWEADASTGGTATCVNGAYAITASVTIGPRKIPCDLSITGNGTVVTLAGTLWVTGNITIDGSGGSGVQIRVADSVGNKSVPILADNPGSNVTSAKITINGNSNFYGSTGNAGSYVILVSQNSSAETGGAELAIDVINGATGNVLTYAAHGNIRLQNNVYLRQVTAHKITLINNAIVDYSVALSQTILTYGAGGAWKVQKWKER